MQRRAGLWFVVAVLACAAMCGCLSRKSIELDAKNPSLRYADSGIYFGEEKVKAEDVPALLDDYDIPHDRVVHIRLDPGVKDLREARRLMALLSKAGYTRPVLVTERHAEAVNRGKPKKLK